MKDLDHIRAVIEKHRQTLEDRYKVKKIAVFGSYARGEQTKNSDVDIMVEFCEPVGLLFVHLGDYLEDILGLKVDLITPQGIKKNRKKFIEEELTYV